MHYFGETYAPVARLKVVRLLLTYACLCGLNTFKWMWKMLSWMVS